MDIQKLQEAENLPKSMSSKKVYNYLIGVYFLGGNEVLDISERLHKALSGARRGDPMLQDLLDMALKARNAMVEAIRKSPDGIFVKL